MEQLDYWLLFFGALGASCLVLGALNVTLAAVTTIRRAPFPMPYRDIAAPVKRHRRPPDWPEHLLEGVRQYAAALEMARGGAAWS